MADFPPAASSAQVMSPNRGTQRATRTLEAAAVNALLVAASRFEQPDGSGRKSVDRVMALPRQRYSLIATP